MSGYEEFLATKDHRVEPVGMPVFIYGLVDPDSREVRYVGKSIRPMERLGNHMNDTTRCHRMHWLRGLRARGLRPTMVVLDVLPPGVDWQNTERRWISEGRRRGWRLTNNTSGGDGVPDLPPEVRARIIAASCGRKPSAETRAKIGAASSKRRHDAAWRSDMREKMTGRVFTAEWLDKIRVANRKLSPEAIASIKRRIAAGEKQCDLAREYQVHRTTIQKVNTGKYLLPYRRTAQA